MARASKKKATARKKTTAMTQRSPTDMASIKEQLQREREAAGAALGTSTGAAIKLDQRSGMITLPGGVPVEGNELDGVIYDYQARRTWYESDFDIKNQSPPDCWSLGIPASLAAGSTQASTGDVFENMVPDEIIPNPMHGDCRTCALNEWGSSPTGGKACNERYLAIFGGVEDPAGEMLQLGIMVTAKQSFEAYVRMLDKIHGVSPIEVVTRLGSVQGRNSWYWTFSLVGENEQLAEYYARRGEAQAMLQMKYQLPAAEAKPKRGGRGRRSAA